MPRPKRAKVASTTARVATTSRAADPAPRQRPLPKPRTQKAEQRSGSFSDDSDGLVVKATRSHRRMPWQPERQKDVDLTMTGALPAANDKDAAIPPEKDRTPPPNIRGKARVSKGSLKGSSARKSPRVSAARPTRPMHERVDNSRSQEEGSSGFGDNLLTFTSLDSESPAHGTRPPSAIKVGATPAHESSILALTNFKRRPRQPSLLRMVRQTTDVADQDSDDLGDFGDFHPDAESTPFNAQKSALEERGSNKSGLSLSSSASRGTKRKLSSPIVQVPRSSPPYDPPSVPDVEVSRSPSPSLPEVIQSTEDTQPNKEAVEPDILSDTMAPPLSSSEYSADDIKNSQDFSARRSKRRARSIKMDEEPGPEREEMERPRQSKGRQNAPKNPGISTAKLQALLPRRRTQAAQDDVYDTRPSDEETPLDSDEDELQLPPGRLASALRKSAAPKPSKKTSRGKKTSAATSKLSSKNTKTYGRRTSSDKENGVAVESEESEGMEETIAASITKPSATLEAIAKKFEEVDAFEMDFESVSYVPDSSSPWR